MRLSLLAPAIALVAQPLVSAQQALCASSNTGSSFKAVSDTYQSNGACTKTCSDYAYGILQGKLCWCSNVAPAKSDEKDVEKDCTSKCPGFPSDFCGSTSGGLFGYIAIGNDPTSTAGGSTATSGTTTMSSSSMTTTSSSSSTTTGTITTSQVAVTTSSDGQVKTITVAAPDATSSSDGQSLDATKDHKSSGLSGGGIAGVVVGVVGGLALIGALVFLVFFYRKRARSASPSPSQDMGQRDSRASSFFGGGGFPGPGIARKSTFTDNRMRTDQVLYPNGPRDSSVSLQDDQDYSRPVLRLANPDE